MGSSTGCVVSSDVNFHRQQKKETQLIHVELADNNRGLVAVRDADLDPSNPNVCKASWPDAAFGAA
jgi:hypothetical protein